MMLRNIIKQQQLKETNELKFRFSKGQTAVDQDG